MLAGYSAACGQAEDDFPDARAACAGAAKAGTSIVLAGGEFVMGDDRTYPEEAPRQTVTVAPFEIDATEVTNGQFAAFVAATGYKTRAERGLTSKIASELPEKFLKPGSMVFMSPEVMEGASPLTWWRFVPGADWRHPNGPGSSIEGKGSFPVVHIAYEDAQAYANWAGRRLPTEAEWEFAARTAGIGEAGSAPAANYWQGLFPVHDTGEDGYKGLAPVGCFGPNSAGLYDMVGNVWELTADVYYPTHDDERFRAEYPGGLDPLNPGVPVHVIKGGSYLCARNYCIRYRPQSRQPQDAFLASSHIGFRTARSR